MSRLAPEDRLHPTIRPDRSGINVDISLLFACGTLRRARSYARRLRLAAGSIPVVGVVKLVSLPFRFPRPGGLVTPLLRRPGPSGRQRLRSCPALPSSLCIEPRRVAWNAVCQSPLLSGLRRRSLSFDSRFPRQPPPHSRSTPPMAASCAPSSMAHSRRASTIAVGMVAMILGGRSRPATTACSSRQVAHRSPHAG